MFELAKFIWVPNNESVNPRHFILINGVLIALIVISFIIVKRGPRNPTRLRLKNPRPRPNQPTVTVKPHANDVASEKSLNVFFNYNGHSWDAYEVLGVPAGSSLDAVRRAFHKAQSKQNGEAYDFVEAAFRAIAADLKK